MTKVIKMGNNLTLLLVSLIVWFSVCRYAPPLFLSFHIIQPFVCGNRETGCAPSSVVRVMHYETRHGRGQKFCPVKGFCLPVTRYVAHHGGILHRHPGA